MSITLTEAQLSEVVKSAVAAAITANTQAGKSKVKSAERPEIDLKCTESQWAFFIDEWNSYKRMTSLVEVRQIVDELRACCTMELRRTLFNLMGSSTVETLTEANLLKKIKESAVVGKNVSVHRKEFYGIMQEPGESLNMFVSRLKAKAEQCNFVITCCNEECDQSNSYSNAMICDQMTVGLYDKDIQQEVLARDKTLDTLDKRYELISAYEKSRLTKSQLESNSVSSSTNVVRSSQYKKDSRNVQKKRCTGCHSYKHWGADRSEKCPAWGKECRHCGGPNHFSDCCNKMKSLEVEKSRSNDENKSPVSEKSSANALLSVKEGNSSYFYSFSSEIIDEFTGSSEYAIPNIEWNGKEFVKRSPHPLPKLQLNLQPMLELHAEVATIPPKKNVRRSIDITAFTDTCAQTCIAGVEVLQKLNFKEENLIPSSHIIKGVTGKQVDIMGVLLAVMFYNGKSSHAAIYVCKNISGFFISPKVQKEIGILPSTYPDVQQAVPITSSVQASHWSTHNIAECGCPKHTPPPEKPDTIPFPPTNENREKLEKWILNAYSSSAFNVCEHQILPKMKGKPLDVHLKEGSTATAVHTPIPVPHHWKKQVKSDLDRDVRLGIIEPVPLGTPTTWCSRMVVVAKKDGKPRRTVDYQVLNNTSLRETHHTPSPYNQVSVVPSNTKKTVLDAWNGYHSLPLSESAKNATTFITEWGRYRYTSAPQGFHAAGDGYTRRFDDITTDFPRKTKCVDDTLLWDADIEGSFWHTLEYLNLCNEQGITFNPNKFVFAEDEVDFAGFTVTSNGIKPMKKMVDAIKNFPNPKNITDIRSFFGLINQVSFTFASSEKMKPFRDLLKKNSKWYWDETLSSLFLQTKKFIINQIQHGVRNFEVDRPTTLWTDWSKDGIGFSLTQKFCNCDINEAPTCCDKGWKLVFAGSRFTTDAESRYAPVEGEALAVADALSKCRMFVLGCPRLIVASDHKGLTSILGDKSLEKIKNPRMFALKEKTLPYNFTMKYVKGKINSVADAFSRIRSTPDADEETIAVENDKKIEASLLAALVSPDLGNIRAVTLERIQTASSSDDTTKELIKVISNGFPNSKNNLPDSLKRYWSVRDELSTLGSAVLFQNRIVVPLSLRSEILEILHSAHQGVTGMKLRANSSVYWPGLSADITNRRLQCTDCISNAPSQSAEPIVMNVINSPPQYPFDQVVTDYFTLMGYKYLLYADRYSGWITVVKTKLGDGDLKFLKKHLCHLFATYGTPREISDDGGPPFNAHEYKEFLKLWGINLRKSSSYYPQSNGRAELAVKTAKRILTGNCVNGDVDNDRVARALLQYRNTPLQGIELSPAQILYGRSLKDHMPTLDEALKIRKEWLLAADDRETALRKRHIKLIEKYNDTARELPELSVSDHVAVQNQSGNYPKRWDKTGKIVETLPYRQYKVKMDGSGRVTLRNRKFLRQIVPVCSTPKVPDILSDHLNTSSLSNTPDVKTPIVHHLSPSAPDNIASTTDDNDNVTSAHLDNLVPPEPRRSNRLKKPRTLFNAELTGQTHSYVPVNDGLQI